MTARPFEPRADLLDLGIYRAPQAETGLRLNTNESPWPPPPRFLDELVQVLRGLELNRYPDRDARALREGLAARHDWTTDGVWAANGSNEILQTLLLAFGGPGRTALVFEPTYGMHTHIARVTGTAVHAKELAEPWTLDAQTMAWGVSFDPPAITFVCSPNNPTGTAHPLEVVRAALESGPGIVVVDEAYGEFGGESAATLLPEAERLVVVRSLSKSWRLAGARIGYLLAHPWLVETIQIARLPYHLSALTQACGEVALRHAGAMLSTVEEIVAERDRLAKELQRVPGVEVFPSAANFLLFRTPLDGTNLWHSLVEQDVVVRDVSAVIPRALRVTVARGEDNARFVEALRGALADG